MTDVIIHEDSTSQGINRVIREMTVGGSLKVLEEITWDKEALLVDFKIIEHPSHTGNVLNKVEIKKNESDQDEHWLTFNMNWVFKGEGPDPVSAELIKVGVTNTLESIVNNFKAQ